MMDAADHLLSSSSAITTDDWKACWRGRFLLHASSQPLPISKQILGVALILGGVHLIMTQSPPLLKVMFGESHLATMKAKGKSLDSAVSNVLSGVLSGTVAFLYILGCSEVHGDLEGMVNSPTRPSTYGVTHTALTIHCGYTVYELIFYCFVPHNEATLMYFHHAIVLSNFLLNLLYASNHYYACLLGLTEATNVCLAPITFFKMVGKTSGPAFLTAAAGTWLGFLVLRLILVPWWTYGVVSSLGAVRETYGEMPYRQLQLGIFSASLILAMSAFWFYKLTRIAVKMLKKTKEKA